MNDTTRTLGHVNVKYVRLEKGKSVSLEPCGSGFGDRQLDFKELLERSLKVRQFIILKKVSDSLDTCYIDGR